MPRSRRVPVADSRANRQDVLTVADDFAVAAFAHALLTVPFVCRQVAIELLHHPGGRRGPQALDGEGLPAEALERDGDLAAELLVVQGRVDLAIQRRLVEVNPRRGAALLVGAVVGTAVQHELQVPDGPAGPPADDLDGAVDQEAADVM